MVLGKPPHFYQNLVKMRTVRTGFVHALEAETGLDGSLRAGTLPYFPRLVFFGPPFLAFLAFLAFLPESRKPLCCLFLPIDSSSHNLQAKPPSPSRRSISNYHTTKNNPFCQQRLHMLHTY